MKEGKGKKKQLEVLKNNSSKNYIDEEYYTAVALSKKRHKKSINLLSEIEDEVR